jgi:hypothetical protein
METQTAPMVVLPPTANLTPEQVSQKSLVHYIWTPYIDINNLGPWGIYSLLGYRDHAWTRFERCKVYPLGNMIQHEKDRQAAEEAFQSGFSVNSASLPDIEYTKYAQEQANELGEQYGQDHGLRVLTPFIGITDTERVSRIFETVQPRAFDIYEMGYEFSEGATKRIRESNLPGEDKAKATEIAKIMLNGSVRAVVKASDEYERLISSMSDKSVGRPGISNPNPFHVWICEQLNKPVPARVDKTAGQQPVVVVQQDTSQIEALMREIAELRASRKPGPKRAAAA